MNRVPRPSPGCDIKSLPLQPTEAFLLSRIDAAVTERELALITGLAPEVVGAALDRLLELGAIHFGGGGPGQAPSGERRFAGAAHPGPPPDRQAATPPPISPREPPQPFGRSVADSSSSSPRLYDPSELDEAVDIDVEKRRRILDTFYRLDELSYYELLGVAEQADKKQIKSAYYALAPEFHPDKFFRKQLGSYKQKIEAVFARATLAHDVLTSKQRRAEYDEYLAQTSRNRTMAALLEQAPRDIASVVAAVEESAATVAAAHVDYSQQRVIPSVPSPAAPGRNASEPRPPAAALARRDTLARKLGRPRSPSPPAASAPPPAATSSAPPSDPRLAGTALRARYEAARAEAQRQQLGRYVDAARGALERKDYAAAANAYRIAASLAPDDAALQKTCAETAQLAAAALAEGFLKQAEYEAGQDRWVDAALSYAKVCNGRPEDARAHERAAFATLKASGSARRAVEFARRAVELTPKVAEFRITLARSYLAAGFEKSALAELDRAAELAPNDTRIADMIARARDQPRPEK